ncbi:metallophosphoesterase [Microbacterium esteraromaticum]|uniref:metallophosphoesterase family protein n=1 Tax=Microbacterium esteraromaticum TaxID=57043 RepID=UPI001C942D93|nr:metallophosphoesterase [Microbacterium esteraromaticum]MBY6059886.1 metallophosphoesterase [Microbacterium esteraromaticum]
MSRATGRSTVLHISDVHVTERGLLYDAVDGIARLRAVGDYVRRSQMTPEAVLITGDLAQRGNPGAYGALRDAVSELRDAVQAPVLTIIGNHDDTEAARTLDGHEHSHHRTVLVDGIRFVLLDSSSGELGAAQRQWLADELATPHGEGTVVAVHHPPLGSPLPTLAKAGLRDAEQLLDILVGTDTRAVLAGHFHHPLAAHVRDIPVMVGPSLAYHQVMDGRADRISGHDRAMFSVVHLHADAVTATSVSLETPTPLFSSSVAVPSTLHR